jgi:D-alanyl-D-alanine carboxypeptidase/D-alanyl-D-alanine-endopeptidase (penicillin-binding protein 4)
MRFRVASLFAAWLGLATSALASLPQPVRDALARHGVPESAVAAVVEPVAGGTRLVEHRAGEPMNPASVTKIVTTYAGLELLGPAFTFDTDFLTTGTLADGVLTGNLIIRGGGDPKLTDERFWKIAHRLRARGLREIRGDVILDRSRFAPAQHDPAQFDGQGRRAYNVGADALLLNFKTIAFRFAPEGTSVRVTAEPDFPTLEIASRLKPAPGSCDSWRNGLQYRITETGLLATAEFTGTYPTECGEKVFPLSVFSADAYAETMFRWVWNATGGRFVGQVRAGPAPADAKLFLRHESEPLSLVIRDINKFSNNVMARQVFLTLSAEKNGGAGEAKASEKVVRDWMSAKGIDITGIVLDNGSGLSRSERLSAGAVTALLRSAWSSAVMPELVASLSLMSVDGTFRRRNGPAAGSAHLKGGTLAGVQAVAGIVRDAKGNRWAVAMLINHEKANQAQPALDALVDWVWRGAPVSKRALATAPAGK